MKRPSGLTEVGYFAGRTQREGGPGWVAIVWTEGREHMGQVVGPFPNQTEAKAWARRNHPRRYRVAGIAKPYVR